MKMAKLVMVALLGAAASVAAPQGTPPSQVNEWWPNSI